MMILVYLIFIGLLSRTSGQVPVVSLSKPYVNKSETVTISCTVAIISDSVLISKDGINLIRCPYPPIPCFNLDPVATAYVAVQNMVDGTTAVTIGASTISRDTGNWTCLYGAASRSSPVSLSVVTPFGLANETPPLNKLPALTVKQATVQEDASDEPQKKTKKKKRKSQINPEKEIRRTLTIQMEIN